MSRKKRYRRSPKGQFQRHKERAKARGVPFLLTFRQWFAIWALSGKWYGRGPKMRQYVMMRKGDEGPYAVGNVTIGRAQQNLKDAGKTGIRRRHTARCTTVIFV